MKTAARRVGIAAATLALAGSSVVTLAGNASAAPAAKRLTVLYDAVGTTTIAKTKSSIALGPAVLTTKLAPSGAFNGTLPFPSSTSNFKALGLVPISATVDLVPVGNVKGKLTFAGTTSTVTTTAVYTIKLSNVKAAGIPTPVGDACQTAEPVTIPLATPEGERFDLTSGGTVTGTFTIGNFANCGLLTGVLNLLVPGPGNTASVTLSNGRAQN